MHSGPRDNIIERRTPSGGLDGFLEVVLAFGLAALLFLVTEELLVDAHESEQNPWLTAAFFGGFLLFILLPGG